MAIKDTKNVIKYFILTTNNILYY